MRNIRTLNDLNNDDLERQPLRGSGSGVSRPVNNGQSASERFASLGKKSARTETFFEALALNLCPNFKLCSVLFFISLSQMVMFALELQIGGLNNSSLLAASPKALDILGQKDPFAMRYNYEIWRFITPVFLHGDLMHLLSNLLAQIMIGSGLSADISPANFAILYFLSGFGGILFSCICSDTLSVGASTAVYGMVGAYLAFLILNWDYLKSDTNRRFQIMVFLFMSLILSIMFTSNSDNIDVLGHLGGFLSGSLLGLFLLPGLIRNHSAGTLTSPERKHHAWMANLGKLLSIGLTIAMLACFYLLRVPVAQFSDASEAIKVE